MVTVVVKCNGYHESAVLYIDGKSIICNECNEVQSIQCEDEAYVLLVK